MDAADAFLWEQVAASVSAEESTRVEKAVGVPLVSACCDVYAEVRALREIYQWQRDNTDMLLSFRLPRATASSKAAFVKLEVKTIVEKLR